MKSLLSAQNAGTIVIHKTAACGTKAARSSSGAAAAHILMKYHADSSVLLRARSSKLLGKRATHAKPVHVNAHQQSAVHNASKLSI